ncbi:hypothetical protein BJ170DRAFT_686440 [Xylariales sp. AK1849]|nr:hypothetical protein BJ170DRAFT_686440 [Xylariales sp. AK1849]
MAVRLPHACALPRRPSTTCNPARSLTPQTTARVSPSVLTQTQTRNATLIRRPRRPYTFTQLVQLSDGSTYTMRSCSPIALYKATKDTRNHALWNPSERSLKNVEVDEAGKLAAFRGRFGRGWDAPAVAAEADAAADEGGLEKEETGSDKGTDTGKDDASYDPLGDLISSYASPVEASKAKAKKQEK